MRKFYSIVLTACALLLSTSLFAVEPVGNLGDLQTAINNAAGGTVEIKLTDDITVENTDSPIIVDGNVTVKLDLSGHNIFAHQKRAIELYHGTLEITGNGTVTKNDRIQTVSKVGKYSYSQQDAIAVFGNNEDVANWSNLTIGEGVKIIATGAPVPGDDTGGNGGDETANGICVLDAVGDTNHGNWAKGSADGVNIEIKGTVYGTKYGIKINGTITKTTGNIPSVKVYPNAEVSAAPNTSNSIAIYSSGYGVFEISGKVHAATGVYIKSGKVDLNNADVASDYTVPYTPPTGQGSGVNAGGSAIVIESNGAYNGAQELKIEGDTKVTGSTGYAIEEAITTAGDSKVSSVKIEGGTIIAGGEGTAVITQQTKDGEAVTVVGGNLHNGIFIKNTDGSLTETEAEDFVPSTGYVITTIIDENDKEVTVVTKTDATILKPNSVISAAENTSVQWIVTEDAAETLTSDKKLDYLEINTNYNQTLTIDNNTTFTVKRIVMGKKGKIVVKPGSKLIVDGKQGIVANNAENIILEANATSQATFVISNEVTSNKQPMASVRYYTDAYGMPKTGTSTNYKWDRLTSPLSEYSKISSNYSTLETKPELLDGETGIWTFIEYYDELNSKWVGLTAYNQMKAFTSYALSNNTKAGGITYTFEGRVQGNVANNIELDHAGWNYMGNAFVAPIHVKSMLSAIENSGAGIDASMYLWDMANQKYIPVNKSMYGYFSSDVPKEIPALQTFIVKLTSGNSAKLDLDYATSVYGYVTNPNTYSAPRRAVASDVNTLRINIKAANGAEDDVYFVESAEFTEDYDNGADITKYMNKGMNFYANGEYAMVASDNIEGATLSLQTIDEVDYTLTFAEVNGEEYALRDNLTGRVVLMTEGTSYRFTAQPNQIVESRFQIVPRQQMPTDISTANETAGSKAVYTVLGQYVGETENWNQLPAGIYVVDGIKIVK